MDGFACGLSFFEFFPLCLDLSLPPPRSDLLLLLLEMSPSSALASAILLTTLAGIQAVPLQEPVGSFSTMVNSASNQNYASAVYQSAAMAEAEASTPFHIRQRRSFDGSPSSAMHELGRGFRPSNRYFPLAVTVCCLLGEFPSWGGSLQPFCLFSTCSDHSCFLRPSGFVVLLCIFKAFMKCRARNRDHLPQTTFDQVIDEPSSLTRFFKRKLRDGRPQRDPSPPLSPGGTSFLAAIPERAHSRAGSFTSFATFASDKDAEDMAEALPRYTSSPFRHQNMSSTSLSTKPLLLPSLRTSGQHPPPSLVEQTVSKPPKVLPKDNKPVFSHQSHQQPAAGAAPPSIKAVVPPRTASMPQHRVHQQATLGVGSGRAAPPVSAHGARRTAYERVITS